MSELRIIVPGTPDAKLSPNGAHGHWSVKHRARQEMQRTAFYAAREAITIWESTHGEFVALSGSVRVKTVIAWGKGRKSMDGDNALASCKAIFDGLAQAGVVENDKQCVFEPVVQIRDKAKVGYVEVTVVAA